MRTEKTIKEMVEQVEVASTTFEKTNTDLKRKFLLWSSFNNFRKNKYRFKKEILTMEYRSI